MKRITVTRPDSKIIDLTFDTQAELDTWKADQISKGRFAQEDVTFEGAPEYSSARSIEFQKIDDQLKEALVEKELGDSTKWDAYIVLRDQIKTDYPKP